LLERFFVWSRPGRDASGRESGSHEVLFYPMRRGGTSVAPEALTPDGSGFFRDPGLSAVILDAARPFGSQGTNFAFVTIVHDGHSYEAVLHLFYQFANDPPDGREKAMFGALVNSAELSADYFPGLVSRRSRFGASELPALAVSIFDDRGAEVFRSGPSLLGTHETEASFPFLLFDTDLLWTIRPPHPEIRYWSVRTGYSGVDTATLGERQTWGQRLIFLFVAIVAASGLTLMVRATTREARVAKAQADFVSSVTHDVKTPLAKIQLFADTLASGRAQTPEKAAAYAGIISRQAQTLDRQISGLLEASRIDARLVAENYREIDLRPVIQAAVATFDDDLSEGGFEVILTLPEHEVPVAGDPRALQRVFENLVSNAMKYSDGERFLRVEAVTEARRVRVEVTDHGFGIPDAEQQRVFERFYRVQRDEGAVVTGSGLGLAIVRDAVRRHQGSVAVRSRIGEGSTFTVVLPLSGESPAWTAQ
jgi:signal transduction histidine kinase